MPAPNYNYTTTNSPSNFGGGNSEVFLTATSVLADNPQLRRQYLRRHNYPTGFYLMLKEMGMGFPLKSNQTVHYEQDWLKQTFSPSVVTGGATAGATSTITLSANDMYTPTFGTTTVYTSYPRVGDIVEIPGTRVQCKITAKNEAVNPHTITVTPASTVTLSTAGVGGTNAFTVGGRYAIVTNSWGEGQGQPVGRQERFIRYTNGTSIIKNSFQITGSSMTDQLPFEPIDGMEGAYTILGLDNIEKKHYDDINNALLFSQFLPGVNDGPPVSGTNTALSLTDPIINYGVQTKGTQGFVPYANANAQIYNHTPFSLTMDDADAYGVILERERPATDLIMGLCGLLYFNDIENVLKDYLDNTCFNYAAGSYFGDAVAMSNPDDFFAYFGFYGFKKGSFRYLLRKMPEFTDPQGMGATGYGYPNYNIMVPMGSFTDGVQNVSFPLVSYEYKELGDYSREIEFWAVGGAGPIAKTSSIDGMQAYWRSEVAGHFGMGNQIIVSKPVNT